jgi:hypothetical protein
MLRLGSCPYAGARDQYMSVGGAGSAGPCGRWGIVRILARRSRCGSEAVVECVPVGVLLVPGSLGMRRPLEVREEPPSRVRRTLGCCAGVGVAFRVGVGVELCGRAARDAAMFGDELWDWVAEFIVLWIVMWFHFGREERSSTSSESFVWSSMRCATLALSDCCLMSMRLVAGRGPRSPSAVATAMRVAGGVAASGAPSESRWDMATPRLEI